MAKAVISQDEQSFEYSIKERKFQDGKSTIKQIAGLANVIGTLSKDDASILMFIANAFIERSKQQKEYRANNPSSGTGRSSEKTITDQVRMLTEDGVLSAEQISQLKTTGVLGTDMAYQAIRSILYKKDDSEKAQKARDELIAKLQ